MRPSEYSAKQTAAKKIGISGSRIRDHEENLTKYRYTPAFLSNYQLREFRNKLSGYLEGYCTGVGQSLRIFRTHEALKEYVKQFEKAQRA